MLETPAPATAILRAKRKAQLSLMEFSLEVRWNDTALGRLRTGLSAAYSIPAGPGIFQLGLFRRFWGCRIVTTPLDLTLSGGDQTSVLIEAGNHTLTVLGGHLRAIQKGFAYDATFGMPAMTFTIDSQPPQTRDWIIAPDHKPD